MRLILFTLIIFVCGPAAAQDTPRSLTVEEAVRLAVRQNPRLAAAVRDMAAARAGARSAQALTNPEVTFAPGITSLSGTGEELLVQQPLELNGTRSARTGVASAHLRQAQAEAVVGLRTLVFETKSAYYELARAEELRTQAQALLRTAEEFDRLTRRQVEVGTRPGIDQTQSGVEVVRVRQQLTQAESRVTVTRAVLNTWMGRPPAEPVGALAPLAPPDGRVETVERNTAYQLALVARAEITAEAARQEGFRQEARLARAQGRPDLVPQLRAGSVIRGVRDAGVGVGISLPFLDYGSRRHRIRQAEESARAQSERITATENQVRQEVEQALARVQAAEAVIRDYQQGVLEQARTLLEASRKGFEAGLTTVVAYLEAQRTYRSVQAEYTNALADYAQARAELERATGAVPAELLPVSPEAGPSQNRSPR